VCVCMGDWVAACQPLSWPELNVSIYAPLAPNSLCLSVGSRNTANIITVNTIVLSLNYKSMIKFRK